MAIGYITARIFTSNAQLPVENAAFTVVSKEGEGEKIIGIRVTDEDGKIIPIPVEAPDVELSKNPGSENPFSSVDIRISHPDFDTAIINDAQVFAGETSLQEMELMPYSAFVLNEKAVNEYNVTNQNL